MKRLLLPLLAALALPNAVEANWLLEKTLGKYNSRYDANEACKIWKLKGFKYTYNVIEIKNNSAPVFKGKKYAGSGLLDTEYSEEYVKYLISRQKPRQSKVEKTKSGFSRSCLEEKETNQFIGRAKSCLKKKDYSLAEWKKLFELKSCEKRKYFKY